MFLIVMPVLQMFLGTGVLGVLYGGQSRRFYMADRLIVGLAAEIGLAEAVHLAAVFGGLSFSGAVCRFEVGIAALLSVSAGVWLWLERKHAAEKHGKKEARKLRARRSREKNRVTGQGNEEITPLVAGLYLVLLLMVIYQITTITSGECVYRAGDMTAETVESFLSTDGVYQVNPLTGRPYEIGVPLRIQVLCLPTLYGILCRIFGLPVTTMVWKLVPLHVLLMSYSAFDTIGRALFAEDKKGKRRERQARLLFMTLVAVILCMGDYLYGMDGFGLLYCGYRGVTIRGAVLLPYVFGLALRRKWRLSAACILAEACLVWTLYGMGACLAVTLGMAVLRIWQRQRGRRFGEAGEEA